MKACCVAFGFTLLAASSITGCLPVPYVTDDVDTSSYDFEYIELNSGTRDDVICEFGTPVRYTEKTISYKVCKKYGVGIIVLTYPAPSGFSLYEKDEASCKEWIIYFDENNTLQRHEKVPWVDPLDIEKEKATLRSLSEQGDNTAKMVLNHYISHGNNEMENNTKYKCKRHGRLNLYTMRLLRAANKGDPVKMLKIYWMSPTGPDRTKWVCRAADKEHPVAQSRVGLLYSQGSEGLPKDILKAFAWYQRAVSNGSQDAHNEMMKIQQAITADQHTRLNELTKDRRPGQCERDITYTDTFN